MAVSSLSQSGSLWMRVGHSSFMASWNFCTSLVGTQYLASEESKQCTQCATQRHWNPIKESVSLLYGTQAWAEPVELKPLNGKHHRFALISLMISATRQEVLKTWHRVQFYHWHSNTPASSNFCISCLFGWITFFPTSNTAVPSHSSNFSQNFSTLLMPSLSYLDPLEDFFSFLSWTAFVCVANLSVKGRESDSEWCKGRWSERERGKRERDWARESYVMYN